MKRQNNSKKDYINYFRYRLHQLNEINSELTESNKSLYEQTLRAIDQLVIDAIGGDARYISIVCDIAGIGGGSNE